MSTVMTFQVNWDRIKESVKVAKQAEWAAKVKTPLWPSWPLEDTMPESIMTLVNLWHICLTYYTQASVAADAEPDRQDIARWVRALEDLHEVLFEELGGEEDYLASIDL